MANSTVSSHANNIMICGVEQENITIDNVKDAVAIHQTMLDDFNENFDYYTGKHPIITATKKANNKPDHRIMVNLPKYIVDRYTSYFIGVPVKVTSDDEKVNEFINLFRSDNDMDDSEYELAKISSIFGRSYEYLSQDENSNTVLTYCTPREAFVVYDNTIYQRPLFGVYYTTDTDGNYTGRYFTKAEIVDFTGKGTKLIAGEVSPNVYGEIPLIELEENEERQSAFENVKTIVDAIERTLSEKMNDVDALADAYMKIIGAEIDEKTMTAIRDNRIINLFNVDGTQVDVDFLTKPDGDTTQENLLNRLFDTVFQIAMVANINDKDFGSSGLSGIALQYKLQAMKDLAQAKERKMKSLMRRRFEILFKLPTNVSATNRDAWRKLKYKFTRNLPNNLVDEANVAKTLEGIVPKDIQLSVLSIVDDPKQAADEMEEANSLPTLQTTGDTNTGSATLTEASDE